MNRLNNFLFPQSKGNRLSLDLSSKPHVINKDKPMPKEDTIKPQNTLSLLFFLEQQRKKE